MPLLESNCSRMDKIKTFIKEKGHWIIIVLFALLMLKSCQSCSRNQDTQFLKHSTELKIDSLKTEIAERDSTIYVLNDSVAVLNAEKRAADMMIKTLSSDKDDYKRISEQLVKNAAQNKRHQSQ